MLQDDARHVSSRNIADVMDVSASTVRKHITRLEEEGIISGYHAAVDYTNAGYQLRMLVYCTAPITERERFADAALDIQGVVRVQEIAARRRGDGRTRSPDGRVRRRLGPPARCAAG